MLDADGRAAGALARLPLLWGRAVPGGDVFSFIALQRRISGSLRYKLLVLAIAPVLAVTPIAAGFIAYWSHSFGESQLLRRARLDLAVASDAFARLQHAHRDSLERLAASHPFIAAFEAEDSVRLRDLLATVRETEGIDALHLTDLQGRPILLSEEPGMSGSSPRSPLQRAAATTAISAVGVEVHSAGELAGEGLSPERRPLAGATPARAPGRGARDAGLPHAGPPPGGGLVVRAVAPVRDSSRTLVALLDGVMVLNRDVRLVDRVRDLVFGPGTLPEGAFGAASLLLGDLRVSTNLPLADGGRAIGTRVSEAVRNRVLDEGGVYVARTGEGGVSYVSGYAPIVDVYGRRVGMLHTGFVDSVYRDRYHRALGIALTLLVAGLVLALVLAARGARAVFAPIGAAAGVVRAIRAGRDARIGRIGSGDEITELAQQVDETLNLLQQRNEEVSAFAAGLESEVEDRTREIRAKNARLEQTIVLLHDTRRQLVAAEKLAALGELTAGVAHEINNPIAVIQGNLEIMQAELGEHGERVAEEMDLIVEQVERVRAIVGKLLASTRRPCGPATEDVPVAGAVERAITLVAHEAAARGVRISRDRVAGAAVRIDAGELEQVLVNLLRNAIQASPPEAAVEIGARVVEEGAVVVSVGDEGAGVRPDDATRIFDPFFSTKGSMGTGLGLTVSLGIVRGYGGDIRVSSPPGGGATFEVLLPGTPQGQEA